MGIEQGKMGNDLLFDGDWTREVRKWIPRHHPSSSIPRKIKVTSTSPCILSLPLYQSFGGNHFTHEFLCFVEANKPLFFFWVACNLGKMHQFWLWCLGHVFMYQLQEEKSVVYKCGVRCICVISFSAEEVKSKQDPMLACIRTWVWIKYHMDFGFLKNSMWDLKPCFVRMSKFQLGLNILVKGLLYISLCFGVASKIRFAKILTWEPRVFWLGSVSP